MQTLPLYHSRAASHPTGQSVALIQRSWMTYNGVSLI